MTNLESKKSNIMLVLVVLGIFALIAGAFYYLSINKPVPVTENTVPSTSEIEYHFSYPNVATSSYVTMTDSPALQVLNEPLTCTAAGAPEVRAGQTEEKVINSRVFCVTEISEGAAGSVYHQYAYATEMDAATFIYTFTARLPQCQNYEAPESDACMKAQASFDPDTIADSLVTNTEPKTRLNSFRFACSNDYHFQITYLGEGNTSAILELPANENYELQVARSGSGARYVNKDESVVFWEHQGQARIEKNGETLREACTMESSSLRSLQ